MTFSRLKFSRSTAGVEISEISAFSLVFLSKATVDVFSRLVDRHDNKE